MMSLTALSWSFVRICMLFCQPLPIVFFASWSSYLRCNIPLVSASQICFLEWAMHFLIRLSVEVGCDPFVFDILWAMLVAMDLWEVPVLCAWKFCLIELCMNVGETHWLVGLMLKSWYTHLQRTWKFNQFFSNEINSIICLDPEGV